MIEDHGQQRGESYNAPVSIKLKKIEDRFQIVRVLGQGTSGTVYHVKDMHQAGREVALKVLSGMVTIDEHALSRFHDEIKICCNVHHQNIVQAYELVELQDCVGYTMELVVGCDLGKLVDQVKISYSEIDSIMYQLLGGISELHRLKIMHRDIKLENIILRHDGVVKISDLGLIKKLESKGLTKPGILLGTPQYMPPEYIKSSWFDERSDIYACGVVLYELLSGTRRMPHLQGVNAVNHLLKTKFTFPPLKLSKDGAKYLDILDVALALSPDARFQNAQEMQKLFQKSQTPIKLRNAKLKENKILKLIRCLLMISVITLCLFILSAMK